MKEGQLKGIPKRRTAFGGWRSQIAWHVKEDLSKQQRLIYAKDEASAIRKSRLDKEKSFTDVQVERAPYADGLRDDVYALRESMRQNGWNV